jgi:hypothetical protein
MQEWRDWGVKFISKKRRLGDKLASREMAWLDLYCGLKYLIVDLINKKKYKFQCLT